MRNNRLRNPFLKVNSEEELNNNETKQADFITEITLPERAALLMAKPQTTLTQSAAEAVRS